MIEAQAAAQTVADYLHASIAQELPDGVDLPYVTAYEEEVRNRPNGALVVLWTAIDYDYADEITPPPPPTRTIGVRVTVTAGCPTPEGTADLINTLLSATERAIIRNPYLGVQQRRRSAFHARLVTVDYAESAEEGPRRQQAAVVEIDVTDAPDTRLR